MKTQPFAAEANDFILEDSVEHCFLNEMARQLITMGKGEVVHSALEYAKNEHPEEVEEYSGMAMEMEAIRRDIEDPSTAERIVEQTQS
jgi:hypothetical protein